MVTVGKRGFFAEVDDCLEVLCFKSQPVAVIVIGAMEAVGESLGTADRILLAVLGEQRHRFAKGEIPLHADVQLLLNRPLILVGGGAALLQSLNAGVLRLCDKTIQAFTHRGFDRPASIPFVEVA